MILTTEDYIAAINCWDTEQPVSDNCDSLYEALRQTGLLDQLTDLVAGDLYRTFGPKPDRKFLLTAGLALGMGYASDLIKKASETKELEAMLRDENGRPWYTGQRQQSNAAVRAQGFLNGVVLGVIAAGIIGGVLWAWIR